MASQSAVLYPNPMQSISSSSITGSYQQIGNKLPFPARLIKVVNDSTKDVIISWDGVTDHDIVIGGGFTLYDIGTNRGNSSPSMDAMQGTALFAKGTAGTGTIYLVSFYAKTPGEQS
jgi:hypothetical protein